MQSQQCTLSLLHMPDHNINIDQIKLVLKAKTEKKIIFFFFLNRSCFCSFTP